MRLTGWRSDECLLIGGGTSTRDAFLRVREALGDRVAGTVGGSTQHVPTDLAEAAVSTAREVRPTSW